MRRMLAALGALALLSCRDTASAELNASQPELYLISSLPLVFGEGFGLDFAKSDVIAALEKDYRLKLVDLPSQVPAGATLLMAQPRALAAEELVALDQWVRNGGRLVLLADPLLEWPSDRPIGDRLRPPASYADTGLLQHWGLRLDAPDERGPVKLEKPVAAVADSPGTLVRTGGSCAVDEVIATCPLGKGVAIVVADADWLNVDRIEQVSGSSTGSLAFAPALIEMARKARPESR